MVLHIIAGAVAFSALLLYADRTGWLIINGLQDTGRAAFWALLTRTGVGLVFASIAVAFVALATAGAPFEGRHWFVLAAVTVTTVGHLGLRGNTPT